MAVSPNDTTFPEWRFLPGDVWRSAKEGRTICLVYAEKNTVSYVEPYAGYRFGVGLHPFVNINILKATLAVGEFVEIGNMPYNTRVEHCNNCEDEENGACHPMWSIPISCALAHMAACMLNPK